MVALPLGALAVRTTGIYFIMVTFAFAQMGFHVFNDARWAGGSDGMLLFAKPVVAAFGTVWLDLSRGYSFYYVALACLVLAYLLLRVLVRSPFGRVMRGIRVNEARMQALGYATYGYKLVAFVIAGTLAGVAGFLHTAHAEFVNPALLHWHLSGLVLMMVILGGRGTLHGPVAGAFIMVLLQEYLSGLTKHWMLPMGLFVVAVVLFLPRGIAGLAEGRRGNGG
ncbi:MAG: branched-chain amino acid ABC transporter permease [Alphaproteobacteria bacterium]|nr:branched-chain amino acid ABC transporter permease [Alphaproteobacteria bacterium]